MERNAFEICSEREQRIRFHMITNTTTSNDPKHSESYLQIIRQTEHEPALCPFMIPQSIEFRLLFPRRH